MTIPVSTMPAAIAWIAAETQTLVNSDPDAQRVTVCAYAPVKSPTTDYIVIASSIQRTVEPFEFVGSGGAGSLYETYDLNCIIHVERNSTPLDVLTRAMQLVAYLETAVRTDPSLGGLVIVARPDVAEGGEADVGETGWFTDITLSIHIEAQI